MAERRVARIQTIWMGRSVPTSVEPRMRIDEGGAAFSEIVAERLGFVLTPPQRGDGSDGR